jgi:hypothetical protein
MQEVIVLPNVSCNVSDCSFWKTGNKCDAGEILIRMNERVSDAFYAEFASEDFAEERKEMTALPEQTCCYTFKRKAD